MQSAAGSPGQGAPAASSGEGHPGQNSRTQLQPLPRRVLPQSCGEGVLIIMANTRAQCIATVLPILTLKLLLIAATNFSYFSEKPHNR